MIERMKEEQGDSPKSRLEELIAPASSLDDTLALSRHLGLSSDDTVTMRMYLQMPLLREDMSTGSFYASKPSEVRLLFLRIHMADTTAYVQQNALEQLTQQMDDRFRTIYTEIPDRNRARTIQFAVNDLVLKVIDPTQDVRPLHFHPDEGTVNIWGNRWSEELQRISTSG